MIALAYLLAVVVGLVVLAVALRRRPAPTPPPAPVPPAFPTHALPTGVEADVRVILVAAAQLAARLAPAA